MCMPGKVYTIGSGQIVGTAERPARAGLNLERVQLAGDTMSAQGPAIAKRGEALLGHPAPGPRIGDHRATCGHDAVMGEDTAKPH